MMERTFKNTCMDADNGVHSAITQKGDVDREMQKISGISELSVWQKEMIKAQRKRE